MIQRVQNLYLLTILILNVIYKVLSNQFLENYTIFIRINSLDKYMIVTCIVSFISLVYYKRRKTQLLFNNINLYFQLLSLLFLIFNQYRFSLAHVLVMITFVLILFANRGIRRDEDLINSIDRLR
jgi:hypothetical protein